MAAAVSDEALVGRIDAVLQGTVRVLRETGARTEALASFEERKPLLGIRRAPVMVPRGRVWRLGVLLLDELGGVHEAGAVTRAVEPGRVTNQNPRAEERRDYRRAAYAAKFAEGDTVNFDTVPVDLSPSALRSGTGVLAVDDGDPETLLVRWSKQSGAYAPLEPYLAERAALLTAPPP